MSCCENCGCVLPPLNGCEENDFAYVCEDCDRDAFDDERVSLETDAFIEVLQTKLKTQQELIGELTAVISSVVELDCLGKDTQGMMALICREMLKRKEALEKK